MIGKALFNRLPLHPNNLAQLPLEAVRPNGWLREQLAALADGLTGNLYKFWPDVSDECAWLGGNGDGWERAPYYLDGLLPLAWLLDHDELKAVAQKYIEWTLASQREDGFFGPAKNTDWWPRMVMLKVLIQYYTASGDARVPLFMLKYFSYQYKNIDQQPLEYWAVARGGENTMCAIWLYNLTGKKFLLELCEKLSAQTLDWNNFFHTFPFTKSMERHINWQDMKKGLSGQKLNGKQFDYFPSQYHFSHVVNVAMGLKTPSMTYLLYGGKKPYNAFEVGYDKLMKHHGVAYGMFTGDEHLSGNSPTQGTELCAVAELMFSLETLLWTQGNARFGDILEKLAFGALPATISKDQWTHQYVQQANQVKVSNDKRPWYNNGEDANVFGLEPNFGCCTANMHQAWPKFAANLWMATEDEGLAAISYAPATIRFYAGGVATRIEVESNYPYDGNIVMHVKPKNPSSFPIYLRIPEWAIGATYTVNGEKFDAASGEFACIDRIWNDGDVINLILPMEPRVTRWYHQSAAVEYGPLTMALPIVGEWKKLNTHLYAPNYEVLPKSEWKYALLPDGDMKVHFNPKEVGVIGCGKPLTITAKAFKLPSWEMEGASADQPPISPKVDAKNVCDIELVPYGATTLRISQFPVGVAK